VKGATLNLEPETWNSAAANFMQEAIRLAIDGVNAGSGGPFGAVVVKEGQIVGRGHNCVTSTNDPTAHAEIVAIRDACRLLRTFHLDGCEIYASCEPCPMCLAAIYWAHLDRLYFGATAIEAAAAGFDDHFIYRQFSLPTGDRSIPAVQMMPAESQAAFEAWKQKLDRIEY
jgi:tRNA(Arg) A34 adenosine deaminase TadA